MSLLSVPLLVFAFLVTAEVVLAITGRCLKCVVTGSYHCNLLPRQKHSRGN